MASFDGFDGNNARLKVCDRVGKVLYDNDPANLGADGKNSLVGTNLIDCHPEPAWSKLLGMMERQETNVYTIDKAGVKKLIYQAPWYEQGEYAGFMELSLVIPFEMPHFHRE